jgi:hypothetical protein
MRFVIFLLTFLVILSCNSSTDNSSATEWEPNLAYRWGKVALDLTAMDTDRFNPRPTVTSRMLGITFTAIFDAWTAYDAKATPVYMDASLKRPNSEHTLENKEIAISYAAYHTLKEYYFSDSLYLQEFMSSLGLDFNDLSMDPETPVGIGNIAANTIIEARKTDGSNHYGEVEGSQGRYWDYTGYNPTNSPDELVDINKWQPKYFADGKGGYFAPRCLTPYWHLVKPLMLERADQFRPGPPPMVGSKQLEEEVQEVIDMQANLTPEQIALIEFMRDGPRSVQQAGHWLKFAQEVSVRDKHGLDDDVKMYFLVEAAAMDAFIASWDTKMFYDYARPFALVHEYHKDKVIIGWAGENKGFKEIKGQDWRPYSPETFLCPPFPSYVSGHSTVSGACAEVLKLFKNDDYFGSEVKLVPGILTEPESAGDTIVLKLPTFTETAELAGISRVLGGYHIQADNIEGLILGRNVGNFVWEKYLEHIGETEAKLKSGL